MDVQARLAELRRVVGEARSMPMSASVVVNKEEVLGLLDGLSTELDRVLADSREVVAERDALLAAARQEADRIVEEARAERERMVADSDVHRQAQREAAGVLERAREEADGLRQETDEYVDAKLANFQITLERITEAVQRGRSRLAGQTAHEGVTPEEVDKLTLPEHLDG
jgi:cell division septum initiation protein DivIVA